jgi:hypothetical protein
MWQDYWRPCAVFTATSEGFAPYYLAEIRHDLSQTTLKVREMANVSPTCRPAIAWFRMVDIAAHSRGSVRL